MRFKSYEVSIGQGTFVNYGCLFDGEVTVGRECAIGFEVAFTTASHELGPSEHRAGPDTRTPIVVGDGVWIGTRALILPGVTIGNGAVVAAGAVVTRDLPGDAVYAGVPAKEIRKLG